MKKIALPLLAVFAITACTKSTPAKKTTSSYFITASTTSGKTFSVTGTTVISSGTVGDNTKIGGTMTGSAELEFGFTSYSGKTGTYAIDGTNISGTYADITKRDSLGYAVHGTLIITSVSPDVIGTFNFTRADSVVVTGSFEAPIPS